MTISTGALRKRIYLQVPNNTVVNGTPSRQWSAFGPYWAEVRPATGKEVWLASQIQAVVSLAVTLRYNPSVTITPPCRFLYGQRLLNVEAVMDEDERHYQVTCLCSEKVGAKLSTISPGGISSTHVGIPTVSHT